MRPPTIAEAAPADSPASRVAGAIAPEELRELPREERAAAIAEPLDAARAAVAAMHRAGASGDRTAREWAHAVDAAVIALFRAARSERTPEVALVAVGGFGRAELCPASDLDLWFVTDRPDHAEVARLADEVLYPLWDLKLDVGHAVRSGGDCVALAREDLAAATALLDARFLDGERRLHDALTRDWQKRLAQREASRLVEQLAIEKASRHEKFGDTVFLLEPNVKNGEGGYRDLLVGLWAAKARFRIADFADMLGLGQATARQVGALASAREFFLRLRTAAHLHAKRRQDRLLFEIQEAIAPSLMGLDPPTPSSAHHVKPAVAPAVEALMQRYYLHAKAVQRETARLLERCAAAGVAKRPVVRRLDHAFVLWNGQLSTVGPEVFRDRPAEMVRLFRVALETGVDIYGHTRELVAEACAQPATAAALAEDPAAARDFAALLADDRDLRSPSLLEQMHDLGLLVALMPEFGPCTGRAQHDLYHVFTVDQHQLYAVAKLKALARGELEAELPVASRAMREVQPGERLALYLGTLLHDVGKPLGKNHSEKGAKLAVTIARRLRLDEPQVADVEFLVRQHLLVAHLSQRRDLNDAHMVAKLAAQLGGPKRLRDLYLLTVADMSMVAPGNLTAWKEQLLRELYVRALAHYRRGPDLAGADRSRTIARRRARLAELLGERVPEATAEVQQWMAGLPDRYFAQTAPRDVVRHGQLSRRRAREGRPVAVQVVHHPRQGSSELTVIADDAPGLLAKIAGVLLASRVDVHGAQINSRDRPGATSEAIDVFTVRDQPSGPQAKALGGTRGERLAQDLERVLSGAISVEALLGERRERSGIPPRVTPHVPTEVEIDEDVSADFTVIDVYTQDRPGVLYTITRTLSSLGLDIHLSKVATEADRVADVFYVRDGEGRKLGPARAAEVVSALHAALDALP